MNAKRDADPVSAKNARLAAAAYKVAAALPKRIKILAHASKTEQGPDGEDRPIVRIVVPETPTPRGWYVLFPPAALPPDVSVRIDVCAFVPGDVTPPARSIPMPMASVLADGFRFEFFADAVIPLDEEVRELDVMVLVGLTDGTESVTFVSNFTKTPPEIAEVSRDAFPEQDLIEESNLLAPWSLGEIDLDAHRP
jgi:hypothetical protein